MKQKRFNWKGKNVLVTGAGGFIGSHLVEELVSKGARVRAMVRYNSRGTFGWLHNLSPQAYAKLDVMQGDLRDLDFVLRAAKGMDTVFHLGAMISIPYSYVNPSEVIATNVNGTLNVLNACRMFRTRKLVHTSTSEVYGTAQYIPIDETHPLQGQSPYSASKIGADKLVESFYRTFDLPAVTVRPFNTFGPRQSARAIIPTVIAQALTKKKISLGSLTPTRDLTYVSDTVAGFLRAAESGANVNGRTVNLGTNSEVSIGELVETISGLLGGRIQIKQDKKRIRPKKSEVERLLSNNQLAEEVMGWSPQVTLKEGLRRTIRWFRSNRKIYERAQNDYVV